MGNKKKESKNKIPAKFTDFVADVDGKQTAQAKRLLLHSGCPRNLRYYGYSHIRRVQTHLDRVHGPGQIRIVVLKAEKMLRVTFRSAEKPPRKQDIVLVLHQRHYWFIGDPRTIFRVGNKFIIFKSCVSRLVHIAWNARGGHIRASRTTVPVAMPVACAIGSVTGDRAEATDGAAGPTNAHTAVLCSPPEAVTAITGLSGKRGDKLLQQPLAMRRPPFQYVKIGVKNKRNIINISQLF